MSFSFFSNLNYCQKILWKNHHFLWWISRVVSKFYLFTNIFDLYTFDNETKGPFDFWIFRGNAFFLCFFLSKRNNATSFLMIHLKCAGVHYANLNTSSINNPYLWAVEYDISFFFSFEFLFTFILTRLLSKTLWKNYHF